MPKNSAAQSSMLAQHMQSFSDGIFAFAMTLLILEFQVPDITGGDIAAQLIVYFKELWPKFVCYVMSFLMLGVFWIGHHTQFHFIKQSDRLLHWIGIVFLMLMVFVPFSTAFIGRYWQQQIAIDLYGLNVIFGGLLLYAHWHYAVKSGHAILHDPAVSRMIAKRIFAGMSFYVLAIALSRLPFFKKEWSLFIYSIIPLTYLIPGKIDRYLKEDSGLS